MLSLEVLNINGNNFTGPIPSKLLTKWCDGALLLRFTSSPENQNSSKLSNLLTIIFLIKKCGWPTQQRRGKENEKG
ncbi:hypothetical protein Leryth_024781 [Lithospermum erythrorhizon]|nr:hypothetical protein Leryth_024781 [Lithospermum erythrorhizon]